MRGKLSRVPEQLNEADEEERLDLCHWEDRVQNVPPLFLQLRHHIIDDAIECGCDLYWWRCGGVHLETSNFTIRWP